MFKNIFDVIDVNKLKPFFVRWAHDNKDYKNEFIQNGTINNIGQVQFNSTGSAAGMARGFCDAINSVTGFNGSISASSSSSIRVCLSTSEI